MTIKIKSSRRSRELGSAVTLLPFSGVSRPFVAHMQVVCPDGDGGLMGRVVQPRSRAQVCRGLERAVCSEVDELLLRRKQGAGSGRGAAWSRRGRCSWSVPEGPTGSGLGPGQPLPVTRASALQLLVDVMCLSLLPALCRENWWCGAHPPRPPALGQPCVSPVMLSRRRGQSGWAERLRWRYSSPWAHPTGLPCTLHRCAWGPSTLILATEEARLCSEAVLGKGAGTGGCAGPPLQCQHGDGTPSTQRPHLRRLWFLHSHFPGAVGAFARPADMSPQNPARHAWCQRGDLGSEEGSLHALVPSLDCSSCRFGERTAFSFIMCLLERERDISRDLIWKAVYLKH